MQFLFFKPEFSNLGANKGVGVSKQNKYLNIVKIMAARQDAKCNAGCKFHFNKERSKWATFKKCLLRL